MLVLLLVVGGGAYYLVTQKNTTFTSHTQNKSITNPTTVLVTTENPQLNEAENWKIFSSTTFNLSYKYPSDWKNDNFCKSCATEPMIESSSERYLHPVGTKYPDGITYMSDAKNNSVPLSYFINSLKTRNLTNITAKELTVNGSYGYLVIGNDETGKKIALAVFENNDYIFQFRSSEEYISDLETLLSTVTF